MAWENDLVSLTLFSSVLFNIPASTIGLTKGTRMMVMQKWIIWQKGLDKCKVIALLRCPKFWQWSDAESETDLRIYKTDLWLSRETGGKVMVWELVVSRWKLLYLETINKFLLYSTGNYTQSPGIEYDGKEYF